MYECPEFTIKERLAHFAGGIGLAVILLWVVWATVLLIWAASDHTPISVSSHTGPRMAARSAVFAVGSANFPEEWEGKGRR